MAETAGKAISRTELKVGFGKSVLSPTRGSKDHQGRLSDPTSFEASSNVDKGGPERRPTPLEKKIRFLANPRTVSTLTAAGFSDDEIYDMLPD